MGTNTGRKEIKEDGKKHRFSATNQPRTRKGGRKQSIAMHFVKDHGYKKYDILKVIERTAFVNEKELHTLATDEAMPVIVKVVAKCFIQAIRSGEFKHIKDMMELLLKKVPDVNVNIAPVEVFEIGGRQFRFNIGGPKEETPFEEVE